MFRSPPPPLQHADDSSQYDYTDFKSLTLDEPPQQAQRTLAAEGSHSSLPRGREEGGARAAGEEGEEEGDQEGVVGQGARLLCPTATTLNSSQRHQTT